MKRVEHLLNVIRRSTDNLTEVTDTAGLSDDELIEYLNDAQSYLQQELEQINNEPFTRESFIDSVARREAYQLPARIHLGENVKMVEYAASGSLPENYRKLRYVTLFERRTVTGGFFPQYYTVRNNQILLSPFPSTSVASGIRLNAVQAVPKLDKRRAKIADIEIDYDTGAVNELTVEVDDYTTFFAGASAFSSSNILVDDNFCLVDRNGVIIARNIPILGISEGPFDAGVCDIGAYTPETALDNDDFDLSSPFAEPLYLVAGADATTHSELPQACEPFLVTWGKWQVLERDKMFDESMKMQARLTKLEETLRGAWARINDDVNYITILNSDYRFA